MSNGTFTINGHRIGPNTNLMGADLPGANLAGAIGFAGVAA
jgi:hypothetical protein